MGPQLTRTHDADRTRPASQDTDAEHPAGVVCSILFRDPARAGDVDQAPPACSAI